VISSTSRRSCANCPIPTPQDPPPGFLYFYDGSTSPKRCHLLTHHAMGGDVHGRDVNVWEHCLKQPGPPIARICMALAAQSGGPITAKEKACIASPSSHGGDDAPGARANSSLLDAR
jgi:hypothetical protein